MDLQWICGGLSCLGAAIHNIRSPSCWPRIRAEPKTFKPNGFGAMLKKRIEKVYAEVCPDFLAWLKKCVVLVVMLMVCTLIGNEARYGCFGEWWEGFAPYSPKLLYIFLQTVLTDLEDKGFPHHSFGARHLNQWRVKELMTRTESRSDVFKAKLVEPNTPEGHKGHELWGTPSF